MEELNLKALLADESFINYCKGYPAQDVAKWENWLQDHAQYRKEVEEQKRIVQTLAYHAAVTTVEDHYLRLKEQIAKKNKKTDTRFRISPWLKIAASLLLIGSLSYLMLRQSFLSEPDHHKQSVVIPGEDKALLTLADGSTILLDEVAVGTLALEGGVRVEKTKSGQLIYSVSESQSSNRNASNTITTPKGGQYRLTLPDGSKAWLNASSTLYYPLHFEHHERRVKMTGEVYFEIAKMEKRQHGRVERIPFYVETAHQEIQVLGTHFNVNSYPDEPGIVTTLLEGSVRVTSSLNGESILLRPGQQSFLDKHLVVSTADVEQQVAWTAGDFVFKSEPLTSILRKVSRWYDVDIVCPPHLGKLKFDGIVSRSQPVTAIMDMVEITGKAKLKLIERRIIVTD